jgi:hypothetical protein
MFIFLFFGLLSSNAYSVTPVCEQWFKLNQLDPKSKNCLFECTSASTGMGSFNCPSECKDLCKTNISEKVLLTIQNIASYPGLTEAEKALIAQYPVDSVKVFLDKEKTVNLTKETFNRNAVNDESDAFRHFVWACLLTIDLGDEQALKFLSAHETDPSQEDFSRNMDISNNKLGISKCKQMKKDGTTSMEDIKNTALEQIKQRTLIYIKSQQEIK